MPSLVDFGRLLKGSLNRNNQVTYVADIDNEVKGMIYSISIWGGNWQLANHKSVGRDRRASVGPEGAVGRWGAGLASLEDSRPQYAPSKRGVIIEIIKLNSSLRDDTH